MRRFASLASISLSLLALTPAAAGDEELQAHAIEVSFTFPGGSVKSASVTHGTVRGQLRQNVAYMLISWVEAALGELGLPHETRSDGAGTRLVSIGGVANSAQGHWVHLVNGHPSSYALDTQTIEGVSSVSFVFRKSPH